MPSREVEIRLTANELRALYNLADKNAGAEVDLINIADARALTKLGLAARAAGGWKITDKGMSVIDDPIGRKPPEP